MNILPAGCACCPEPTACLACLLPAPPAGRIPTCDTEGILSGAVNLVASIQVTEALKILTAQPHLLRRTLLSIDLWSAVSLGRSEVSAASPSPGCTVCEGRSFQHLAGANRPHVTLCGRNSVQNVRSNHLLLRFERPPLTLTLFTDGRALIQGTTDPATARSFYARFVGT
jgi:hypothetical protein